MSEEREVIKREFPIALETTGDGRTLELRVVPWNTLARVTDNGRDFYDEEWLPGCFDRQLDAPNRIDVLMNFEHERGIGGVVGRGTDLRNTADGFEGTFRMLNAADADKALELVNEGVLTGISLEAVPIKSVREDGIVKRVAARLVNIALCRSPAFPQAKVLAVREAPEGEPDEPAPEEPQPDEPESVLAVHVAGSPVSEAELAGAIADRMASLKTEPEPVAARSDVEEALQRVGFEPLITRAVTRKPWDGSASRFSDEQYQRSCLLDRGGDAPPKERYSLPVLEPNGDLNVNAMAAAASRLNQTRATPEQKAAAARKLMRYYRMVDMMPPPSVQMMAGR